MPSPTDHLLTKPKFDWPIAAVVTAVILVYGSIRKAGLVFAHLPAGTRSSLYVTVAGIGGALLGFFIATIAILLGFLDSERPRLKKALAGNHASMVQPIFFSAIYTSALSILVMLILLVVDTNMFAREWMEAAVLMVLTLAALRTARLVWLLRMLVLIATRDSPTT